MKILKIERSGPLAESDAVTIRMSRRDLDCCLEALKGYAARPRRMEFDQVKRVVLTAQHMLDAWKSFREKVK